MTDSIPHKFHEITRNYHSTGINNQFRNWEISQNQTKNA